MRRALAVLLTALTLALTACTGLPTSGTVNPGLSPVDADSDPEIRFVPNGPQDGASPEDIVNGFIRAGSGPQGEWAIARQFLTSDLKARWNPRASVTIDRLSDRTAPTAPVDGVSTIQVVPTGFVDATGAYQPQDGSPVTLDFTLEQVNGEWRISDAPDGVVLFEEEFRSVYRSVSLQFFDRSWRYLVPDERWFPSTSIATAVATALVDGGPSPWLAGAVRSAFPDDVSVVGAVPAVDNTATVELDAAALPLGQTVLDRMLTQLRESLRSVDVTSVSMTVGGATLDASAVAVQSTMVDQRSLVERADGTFGFVEGQGVEAVPVSEAIEQAGANAVEVAPSLDTAAVRTTAGVVLRAGTEGQLAVLDERSGLIEPSIDPSGAVWTATGADPTAVRVYPAEGAPIAVGAAWPGATSISAMRVSRDGTRVAAAVVVRGQTQLWVSSIRRDDDGVTISLGTPVVLATLDGTAASLAWLDDGTVGALVTSDGETALREQPIGGPGTDLTVPDGTVALVGGNSNPRLRTADGGLYVRQGPSWAQVAGGIGLLAVQQGMPAS
ncbi:LpqB family beta-propeller domain-containing protein [Microbacterium sp. NPDC091313]